MNYGYGFHDADFARALARFIDDDPIGKHPRIDDGQLVTRAKMPIARASARPAPGETWPSGLGSSLENCRLPA